VEEEDEGHVGEVALQVSRVGEEGGDEEGFLGIDQVGLVSEGGIEPSRQGLRLRKVAGNGR
jgi:hypothetical protein